MSKRAAALLLALVLTLGAAACGGTSVPDGAPDPGQQVLDTQGTQDAQGTPDTQGGEPDPGPGPGPAPYDWKTDLPEGSFEVTDGMIYLGGQMTSSSGSGDYGIYTVSFDPDAYVVLPFTAEAGRALYLHEHYERALELGYDVAAVINGDFFDTTGTTKDQLNAYLVTNGEVEFCNASRTTRMSLIDSAGRITSVDNSKLSFRLWLGGEEVEEGVGYINWHYDTIETGWNDAVYYYDSHATADKSPYPGVLVLCERLRDTVLTPGGVLEGRVVSVDAAAPSSGVMAAEDQFLLWVPAYSSRAVRFSALVPGDSVVISASETLPAAAEQVQGAVSILANLGWLIRDGVDLARDDSFNAGAPHSNTYEAHWTAFGTRDDGSWMFFTSDSVNNEKGERVALTLKDVSAWMLAHGVTDAIRLDGGGSTALYVADDGSGAPGYMYHSAESEYGRRVSDCLLVVKRSSPALAVSDASRAELAELMALAGESGDESVAAALRYARAVAGSESSVSGEYRKAISGLRWALSSRGRLLEDLDRAAGADFSQYSRDAIGDIRAAFRKGAAVLASDSGDGAAGAADTLEAALAATGGDTVRGLPLDGVNTPMTSNSVRIYTAGQSLTAMNLGYTKLVILRYEPVSGAWVVQEDAFTAGSAVRTLAALGFSQVPEDTLLVASHNGGSAAGARNDEVISQVLAGQILVPDGLDLLSGTREPCAFFSFTGW